MKAKEIALRFSARMATLKNSEELPVIMKEEIMDPFINDLSNLIKQRNIQTDEGLFSLIKELNNKWNTLAKRLFSIYKKQIIIYNGFYILIKEIAPEIYKKLNINSLKK